MSCRGPAGLLAYDHTGDICSPVPTIYPLAVSPDGVTWRTVTGNIVANGLDAGPMGFIATEGTSVEISQDGINWTKTKLSGTSSARVGRVDSAASFTGGFVVWSETYEGTVRSTICGPEAIYDKPALWFSVDGKTWTPEVLPDGYPGKVATGDVCSFDGSRVLADEWGESRNHRSLSSPDGATWTSSDVGCGDISNLALEGHFLNTVDPYGDWTAQIVGPDLQFHALAETGDGPIADIWASPGSSEALGPGGLIVSNGQGTLWIGVPTAG